MSGFALSLLQRMHFRSIRTRLSVYFCLLFLVILIAIETINIIGVPFIPDTGWQSQQQAEVFGSLNLIADLKKERLLRWLEERRDDIHVTAENDFTTSAVSELLGIIGELKAGSKENAMLWSAVSEKKSYIVLANYLNKIRAAYGVYDKIQIAEAQSGIIFISTDVTDLGSNVSHSPYLTEALRSKDDYIEDIKLAPQSHGPVFHFGHVIQSEASELMAVLIMEINADDIILPMLHTGEGLGKRGEALLVNKEGKILTSLKHPLPDGTRAMPLEYRIESEPAILAASGKEGIIDAEDYRGEPVLAAYRYIQVTPDWGWGMVVKRDKAELFAPMRQIMVNSFLVGLTGIFIFFGFTFVLSKSLTDPIHSLSRTASKVAEGNLDARSSVTTADEVGVLATTFNSMVEHVQNWHKELEKQVNVRTAELTVTNETLQQEITMRELVEKALQEAHRDLETRVEQRTAELKVTHEQLLHAEKLSVLGKMAASIAHEFNNPLFGIKMVLEQLAEETDLNKNETKSVNLAIKECTRISHLIATLKDFYRPSTGVFTLADINQIILETLQVCQNKLKISNTKIIKDFAEELPEVNLVVDQIKQVFLNLITNAEEAMGSSGCSLTIQTRIRGDNVRISFKDDGQGITKENIEKIFDPFFTTKMAVKGTGLGLSVSYGIIKKHSGNIWVESTPNQGSTFTVELPLIQQV